MTNSIFHPTLYTPATLDPDKLLALFNGESGAAVYRLVLCTEDSISEDEVPQALETLREVLHRGRSNSKVATYVRVRNLEVLKRVLELPKVDKLQGFVIPKADPESFDGFVAQLAETSFKLMPILESKNMFDRSYRTSLLHVLMKHRDKIECLRIGANDLMGYLGIRRSVKDFTVYDTPIGPLISDLILEYRGLGEFLITAPVFECFGPAYDELLSREVRQHILNGLYGQTVIHPRHIRKIRDLYKVTIPDLESARNILGDDAKAVNGLYQRMDEYTTHWRWAQTVLERYRLFGDDQTSRSAASVLGL